MPKESTRSGPLSLLAQVIEPADQPFVDTGRALIKAAFLFTNHPERPYQKYDLTLAQIDVLTTLAGADGTSLNCSEIAERTLITKGGITGILDRLEARGLVKRIPSRDDRRSVFVRLSAKGLELFCRLYPELVHLNRSLLEKTFKPEQMKLLSSLLQLLIHSLESGWGKSAEAHTEL
jgi:MarR family 2-MHQ and catechol resistance regulon transcriptional repressor